MQPVNIFLKILADANPLKRAGRQSEQALKGVRHEAERTTAATQQLNAASQKSAVETKKNVAATKQLDAARKGLRTTNRQMLQQERFIGDAFGANAQKINKQYLQSVNGLRMGLARLRREAQTTIAADRNGNLSSVAGMPNLMRSMERDLKMRFMEQQAVRLQSRFKNLQWTGRQMMVGVTAPLMAVGAAAAASAMEVDELSIRLEKLVDNGSRSAKEVAATMENLDKQARTTASRLGTKRTDTMSIQARFAQTGFDPAQIEEATKQTVNLMSYGDVDQETATEMVRQLLQLGIGWEGLTDQLDKFNAMDDRTNLSLAQTAAALPQVYPLLHEFNVSAAGTAALMAGITEKGYDASEAATALRNAFTKIPAGMAGMDAASEGAQARLKIVRDSLVDVQKYTGIDIKLVDENGKIKDGMEIITNVMQGLNELEKHDANKAVLARRAFFGSEGAGVGSALAASFEDRGSDLYKAMDIALAEAGSLHENTMSQLEKVEQAKSTRMKAAIEEARIAIQDLGLLILPTATKVVEAIGGIVEKFNALPSGVKAAILGVLGAIALVGPVVYAFSQIGLVTATMFGGLQKMIRLLVPGFGRLKMATTGAGDGTIQFHQALDRLDRNLAEGIISADAYDEKLEKLKEEYGDVAVKAKIAEEAVDDFNDEVDRGRAPDLDTKRNLVDVDTADDLENAARTKGVPFSPIPVGAAAKAGEEAGEELMDGVAKGAEKKKGVLGKIKGIFTKDIGPPMKGNTGFFSNMLFSVTNLIPLMPRLGTAGAGAGAAINGSMIAAQGGLTGVFAAAAPIAAILALIGVVAFAMFKNWDQISKGIGDSFTKLIDAGKELINAVLTPFRDVMDRISGKSEEGGKAMGSMWEDLGEIIGDVADGITRLLEIVTPIAEGIARVLSEAFFIIINVVKLVVSIIKGDMDGFKEAIVNIAKSILNIMLDIAGAITTAFIGAFAAVVENAIELVDDLAGGIGNLLNKIPGVDIDWDDSFEGLKDTWTNKADMAGKYFKQEWDKLGYFRDGGKKKGKEAAEGVQEGIEEVPTAEFGDPTLDPDAASNEGKEAAESFLSSFWNRMKGVVAGWKEAALSAFDDWADAQVAAVDAKLEAIDKEVEAERKKQEDLDYLQRKEELRNKRRHAAIRHQADRDLAVFEGRYDDVVQLDYEYDREKEDLKREEEDIEKDRQQTLTDRVRQGEKDRLDLEKESLKERLDEKRKHLQDELDAMTEYIPKNVAEAQRMQEEIQAKMKQYTDGYGAIGTDQARNWGNNWHTAWNQAVKDFQDSKAAEAAGNVIMEQFAKGLGLTLTDGSGGSAVGPAAPAPYVPMGPGTQHHADSVRADRARNGNLPQKVSSTIGMVSDAIFGSLNRHTGGSIGNTSMSPSDVPATLQTGEYVVRRSAVSKFGTGFMEAINRGEMPTFHTGGYVGMAKNAIGNALGTAATGFAHGLASIKGLTADSLKSAYQASASGGFGGYGSGGQINTSGMTTAQIVDNVVKGTHPDFQARVDAWNKELGGKYRTNSGYRSMASQARLYARWLARVPGQAPAAAPGRSYHNFGLAIDLSPSRTTAHERNLGKKYGLVWPMSYEPWHVQPVEAPQWKQNILNGNLPGGSGAPAPGVNLGAFQLAGGLFGGANAPLGGTVTAGKEEVKSIVRGMLGRFGWGMDQWPALDRLVSGESSWNPSAANPTSSARGLFQKMTSLHGPLEPTIEGQAQWGLNYIKGRYGTPAAAYSKWSSRSPHWYHRGGMVFPSLDVGGKILEDGIAKVHKNERVLTAAQTANYENNSGGVNIELNFQGGYFGTDRELTKLVDTIESKILPKIEQRKGNSTRSFKTYK